MLIEQRCYTLRLGATQAFWDAQRIRGEDGLAPIQQRLIGTWSAESGATDQIVSLYRYDDFADWETRLMGLYGKPELLPYFKAVRPLIVAQKSSFLRPAPLDGLTPYWRKDANWLPAGGFPVGAGPQSRDRHFEELTLTFSAGGVPACWKALGDHGLNINARMQEGLRGVFSSIAGELNQVLIYRAFPDAATAQRHRRELSGNAAWRAFVEVMAPLTVSSTLRQLAASPVADLSPP